MKYSASANGFFNPKISKSMPPDAVDITDDVYKGLLAAQAAGKQIAPDGNGQPVAVVPAEPSEAQIIAALTVEVQDHLDTEASTHGYDNILSLCTYASDPDPVFAAEGQAGVEWRGATWRACYKVMADVKAGYRPTPTAEELITELPTMVWPA